MRRWALFSFLLLTAAPVFALKPGQGVPRGSFYFPPIASGVQINILQTTGTATTGASSVALQLASNGTSGSTLVIVAQSNATGGEALSTPTGFTLATSSTIGNYNAYIWYKRNFSVGTTSATVATASTNNALITASMMEYSNMNASPVGGTHQSTGSGTSASTSLTISGSACIALALAVHNSVGSPSMTAANGFTMRHSVLNSGTFVPEAVVDFGNNANFGSSTVTPTVTMGSSVTWWIFGVGFCQ